MLKPIGIVVVLICLLPILSIAQTRGSFAGRPSYLVKTTRSNAFKPQRNTPKPYVVAKRKPGSAQLQDAKRKRDSAQLQERKAAVPSFSSKKVTISPFVKKSAVARGLFAHGMSS